MRIHIFHAVMYILFHTDTSDALLQDRGLKLRVEEEVDLLVSHGKNESRPCKLANDTRPRTLFDDLGGENQFIEVMQRVTAAM